MESVRSLPSGCWCVAFHQLDWTPKQRLAERFRVVAVKDVVSHERITGTAQAPANTSRRKRRQHGDMLDQRAASALRLVHLEEVSAAKQAPRSCRGGSRLTQLLTGLGRRAPERRELFPKAVQNTQPAIPLMLDETLVVQSLRTSRRRAACALADFAWQRDRLCQVAHVCFCVHWSRVMNPVRTGRITASTPWVKLCTAWWPEQRRSRCHGS